MIKIIKKGIKGIDFYIKQFVDCGQKNCAGCKCEREVLLEEINRYTIDLLKGQIKEWEETKSNKEELELCKDIDIGLYNQSEVVNQVFENRIKRNKEIIKELEK